MYGSAPVRDEQDLVGHALEGVVHALRRLARFVQELHAGAVGLFFLGALIGQQRALDHRLRPEHGRGRIADIAPGFARGHHRADAEQHRDDHLRLRLGKLLAQPRQMAAGDMAGFVRQHADDLVRHRRFHQRAGVHEDAPAVHDERVERAVVDDDDANVLLREAGGFQDRLGVVAQQLLDLGVANERQPARHVLRARGRNRGDGEGARRHHRKRASDWRLRPHPDRSFDFGHIRLALHALFGAT